MIQIKKGIPRPAARTFSGRPGRYPFADMEVDDCFDVPVVGDEKSDTVLRRMRVAATSWKKRAKVNCGFSVRVVTEDNATLVRVWMTPPSAKAAAAGDMFA
jgi:hypothetical protein